jgi:hypothetical protein
MRMRRCAVIALLLVVMSTAVAEEKKATVKWKKVPDGFRGVTFGASKAEAETVLGKLKCVEMIAVKPRKYPPVYQRPKMGTSSQPIAAKLPDVTPAHTVCMTTDKTKAFTANGKVVGTEYVFDEDRFVAVKLRRLETMRPSQVVMYADILPLFETEYGPPTASRSDERKGTQYTQTSTWDVKQNKQVTRTAPEHYDYVASCAEWTDAKVKIELCARDDLFAQGSIETAGWTEKKRLWMQQEPQ